MFGQIFNLSLGPGISGSADPRFLVGTEWGITHLATGLGANAFYFHLSGNSDATPAVSSETSFVGIRPHFSLLKNFHPDNQIRMINWGLRFGIPVGIHIPHREDQPNAFAVGGSVEFLLNRMYTNSSGALGGGTPLLVLGATYYATPWGDRPGHTVLLTLGINVLFPVYLLADS